MKVLLVVAAVAVLAGCSSPADAPPVYTVPASEMPYWAQPSPSPFPAPPGYVEAIRALGVRGSAYELVHDAEDACLQLMQGESRADVVRDAAERLRVDQGVAGHALPVIEEYFCS